MNLINVVKKSKPLILIILCVWAILVLPLKGEELYQKYLNYQVCSSLEKIANDFEYKTYVSKILESYFSSSDVQKRNKFDKQTIELHDTSEILELPKIDESFLGLKHRVSYYISFTNGSMVNSFDQIGIWVFKSYLAFNVLSVTDGIVRTDSESPIVECWAAESILGPRL